jgi:hypothetical protein
MAFFAYIAVALQKRRATAVKVKRPHLVAEICTLQTDKPTEPSCPIMAGMIRTTSPCTLYNDFNFTIIFVVFDEYLAVLQVPNIRCRPTQENPWSLDHYLDF